MKSDTKRLFPKALVFLLAAVYIMTLSSCVRPIAPEPYGIWVSSDPELILYIDPASRDNIDAPNYGMFCGIYTLNGETIDVLVNVDMRQESMVVYDLTAISPDDDSICADIEYVHFIGRMIVRGNNMICTLYDAWQEKTGYEKIVFEKIEDYPMPEED